jgi:uncharacterized membrane protein YqjE
MFLAGALVLALVLFASGYVFLIVGVVVGLAHLLGVSWIWIALGAAALHFLLAIGCGVFASIQVRKPVFQHSLQELKRDREWLKNFDRKNR